MAGKFSKKLAVEYRLYANYRKEQLNEFKAIFSKQDWNALLIESEAGFIFDEWLIEKGIIPVLDFEKWRKSQI